jgi:pyruvyl transferase EpsI
MKISGLFRRIQWKIASVVEKIQFRSLTRKMLDPHNEDSVMIIGAPVHGNLGDHAIWVAELKFLKDYFPGKKIIEISGDHFRKDAKGIAGKARKGDIITVTGGGFLGNLWMREEIMVRDVIHFFPDNKVVIFPQTIFFESNEKALNEFIITRDLYRQHKDLHIFVRDAASFRFVTEKICVDNQPECRLVPDIVLYLDYTEPASLREGILLCLRDDKEKAISVRDIDEIRKNAGSSGYSVSDITTVLNRDVPAEQRFSEVETLITEFKKAKLVITDRLHGMIFSTITSTPCIAFNNSSGKTKGVFQFITYLKYIRFIESVTELPGAMEELLKMSDVRYDKIPLKKYYDEIALTIKGV